MAGSWRASLLLAAVSSGICGCADGAAAPAPEEPSADLSELEAVEVTTVTTVQGSSGIFLSPRPQQERPAYLEARAGLGSGTVDAPSAELDRAKVDSALLFRGPGTQPLRVEASLPDVEAQHYFPALEGKRWPIVVGGASSGADSPVWSEWDGWRAFAGRSVSDAPAATVDYERLGLQSPVVLTSEGDDLITVTNRSSQAIPKALLVYSHSGGIGISAVTELGPGMRKVTTPGPKEGPPTLLLDKARGELEAFFTESAGPELGRAMAQSKSIPLLETLGLRLIYLLDDAHAPAAVALPRGLAERRRFVVAQAEVLLPTEERHVVSLLEDGLEPAQVPLELGRFSHAKLELGSLNGDAQVQAHAAELLQTLAE